MTFKPTHFENPLSAPENIPQKMELQLKKIERVSSIRTRIRNNRLQPTFNTISIIMLDLFLRLFRCHSNLQPISFKAVLIMTKLRLLCTALLDTRDEDVNFKRAETLKKKSKQHFSVL